MTARRDRGTGGLYKRKSDGLWVGVVDLGEDMDGKRIRKTVSSKSKATASAKLRELRAEVEATGTVPSNITMKDWLDRWLSDLRVAPMTLRYYRQMSQNYIVPSMGRVQLAKVTPAHVRKMLQWIEAPPPDGKGLSASTAAGAHRTLRAALSAAMVDGHVRRNVAKLVKAPTADKDQDSLTVDQAKKLLSSVHGHLAARWAVAILLGLRRGEAIGLEWSRIDLDRGTLDLSWQLQRLDYRHGCGDTCGRKRAGSCSSRELDVPPNHVHRVVRGALCLTRPKSHKKVIPLPPMILGALWAHHEAFGTTEDGLVFTRDDGGPLDPSQDNAEWHRALAAAGLPSMKLHAARHTTGTLLMELGEDAHVVQQILGHASVTTTRGYQHVRQDLTRAALGALGDLLQIED